MLNNLKIKWGVDNLNLCLIILTFALGGSICGRLGRYILNYFLIQELYGAFVFWILYLIVLTLLWPICVITVSIFTGQFKFFKNYLTKIFKRFYRN